MEKRRVNNKLREPNLFCRTDLTEVLNGVVVVLVVLAG